MPGQSEASSFQVHIYRVFSAGGAPHGDFVVANTFGQSNGSTNIRGSGNFCLTINSIQSYTVMIEIPAGRLSEPNYRNWLDMEFLKHFQDAIDITLGLENDLSDPMWPIQAASAADLYTLAENNSNIVAPPSGYQRFHDNLKLLGAKGETLGDLLLEIGRAQDQEIKTSLSLELPSRLSEIQRLWDEGLMHLP